MNQDINRIGRQNENYRRWLKKAQSKNRDLERRLTNKESNIRHKERIIFQKDDAI